MKQKEIIRIYEQEKHRIEKSANYFSYKTGIKVDELIAEANLAFCKSFKTYDKKKASFRTHLHNNIKYALLNFTNQNRRPLSLVELNNPPAKEEISFCVEDNFSPLAAEAIRIIIQQELTHLSQLTQILLSRGFKNSTYNSYPSQIQSIYQEIRNFININKRKRNGNGNQKNKTSM